MNGISSPIDRRRQRCSGSLYHVPNKINRCTISTNSTPRKSGLIGRRLELAGLTATLDDALAGGGQMVMLAGEPGIGKTRLAQELARDAQNRGAQVRCASTVGLVPRTGRRSSILALDAVDSRPGRDDRRWATPPRHGPGGRGHRPVSPRIGRHLGWIGEATGTGTGASPFPPVLLHHDILEKGQPVSAVAARP